jgi:protein TIF31
MPQMVAETPSPDPVMPGDDVPALTEESPDSADATTGSPFLKNLVILPPLQKSGIAVPDDSVPLPPIRAEEPVSSIRQALIDVLGYSHLTNFRFVLEDPPTQPPGVNANRPLISPHTGPNAVVSVPVAIRSLTQDTNAAEVAGVLDDYSDMQAILSQGLRCGSAIRIVLESYDATLVKDHIVRLRSLFDGNGPTVLSLDETGETVEDTVENSEGSKNSTGNAAELKTDDKVEPKDLAKDPPKNMPIYPTGRSVAPDPANMRDFFYLACGEDRAMYNEESRLNFLEPRKENGSKSSKRKKKGKDKVEKAGEESQETEDEVPIEHTVTELIPKLNAVEEKTRVPCTIKYSGFHPPPSHRKLMGDIAYLEVMVPEASEPIHITAIHTGFYVNRSSLGSKAKFDPSPAPNPCFSHELLDCLLQSSESLRKSWADALEAAKLRAKLTLKLNEDGPFQSLFRVAVRSDFSGYLSPAIASADQGIDSLIQTPSWLIPTPKAGLTEDDAWTRNGTHVYSPARTEEALGGSFGIDIRGGATRDWNDELQSAREMPVTSLPERIERARVIYKVLNDFGEASLLGVKGICEGNIGPMNPNEPTRSQVYLHNNIFFSRAVDNGLETFKIAKGDRAARKSASRDVHCLGAMHRMERTGLYTLATVLVDYLGSRYVCQSILPGILSGDKTHTLLCGAVEAGSALVWSKEMHELLEDALGRSLMIATRPVPRQPLPPQRVKEIEEARAILPFHQEKKAVEGNDDLGATVLACAPIEAKGIQGSDQRKYMLDITRLTPRDANWIPASQGGTGRWEAEPNDIGKFSAIPGDVADDEWTLAVLRPELVTSYAQVLLSRRLQEKETRKDEEAKTENSHDETNEEEQASGSVDDTGSRGKEEEENKKEEPKSNALSEEDVEYLKSLRFNVNVFLPGVVSLEGIDDAAHEQIQKDEELARNAAKFLWDEILPRITREIKEGATQHVHDGRGVTRFLHQNGVNCRYLGRLATLAQQAEDLDRKRAEIRKQSNKLDRTVMPYYWLELLETEMVARAAKHVLDGYFVENGGSGAYNPAQMVASFLSALVSENEETAAQTENRMEKRGEGEPGDDDFSTLTYFEGGGEGDAVPRSIRGRFDVWKDIEAEVGRRFRYTLTLYNRPGKYPRARYPALLRRLCQRTGVRLAAKSYSLGGRCMCSIGGSGGQMMASYPISPVDVIDIMPLMKHAAAHDQGFVVCGMGSSNGIPPLHISLPEVRSTLEAAHVQHNHRQLGKALDFAQEACNLFQRVTESPTHPGVVRCLDLMANILYEAGEPAHGASKAIQSLGLAVQISGFDCPDNIQTHSIIFQMLITAGQFLRAAKHLRAAIYLMELLGGPNHIDIANSYHKLANLYSAIGQHETALKLYEEALSRQSPDRLMEAMILKGMAGVLAELGDYKQALDTEKRTYAIFAGFLGPGHQLTKTSETHLKALTAAAVEVGNKKVVSAQKEKDEAAALAIAREIEAEEAAEEQKRKKKNKKRGKK